MSKSESKADYIDDLCPLCSGTGHKMEIHPYDPRKPLPQISPEKCPACDGTGRKKKP